MACKNPMKAFQVGYTEAGKAKLKITPYRARGVGLRKGHWYIDYDVGHATRYDEQYVSEAIPIPCGKCTECRLQYSRQWADRLMLEAASFPGKCYFLTITYNDESLNYVNGFSPLDGTAKTTATLSKKDLQDFMKRLRNDFSFRSKSEDTGRWHRVYPEIKYYVSGEYGPKNGRPHYHMILFGIHIDDLVLYSKSPQGFYYFTSDQISRIWSKGYVVITEVTWETCAYVARYVMKKIHNESTDSYDLLGILPEFSLMSRRPGIGRKYYEDHKDELYGPDKLAYRSFSTANGGKRLYPSKYFDNLFDIDDPVRMAGIKLHRRQIAKDTIRVADHLTSLDTLDRLRSEDTNKSESIKALRRDKV